MHANNFTPDIDLDLRLRLDFKIAFRFKKLFITPKPIEQHLLRFGIDMHLNKASPCTPKLWPLRPWPRLQTPSTWPACCLLATLVICSSQTCILSSSKCEVICENLPYAVTNIVDPGQTPRVMRSVLSGPPIFVAYEHLQPTILLLPVQFQPLFFSKTSENSWSRRELFVPP